MDLVRGSFERTRDHWWWRPGWSRGARYVTFHLTFERAPELGAEAARCGRALLRVPNVDVVPPQWLHLTMTGVGFTHALDPQRLPELATAVFDQLPTLGAGPLTLNGLYLSREGLSLTAEPASWLVRLKRIQEDSVRQVLGIERPAGERFHPHVSLAYFGGEVDLPALQRVIDKASPRPVAVAAPLLSLIELGRDEHLYTWRVLARRGLRG